MEPVIERLCPECRTTDASFPLIPGCKSCAEVISKEEYTFWNAPHPHLDPEDSDFTPGDFLRAINQHLKAFFDLITLG